MRLTTGFAPEMADRIGMNVMGIITVVREIYNRLEQAPARSFVRIGLPSMVKHFGDLRIKSDPHSEWYPSAPKRVAFTECALSEMRSWIKSGISTFVHLVILSVAATYLET